MDELKSSDPSMTMNKLKSEFESNNAVLEEQLLNFSNHIAPYLVSSGIKEGTNNSSLKALDGMKYYRLRSCTVERTDDTTAYIGERIEKLFTALYALKKPVVYGVVSREGKASIMLGLHADNNEIATSVMNGLLTGIDVEIMASPFSTPTTEKQEEREASPLPGGFICSVPTIKIENQKQSFDLSTLMKSLNGKDYSVLFYAKPIDDAQIRYSEVLKVKDAAFAISKKSISRQNSVNTSRTVSSTTTVNTRGVIQEFANQVIRDKKLDFNGLLNSFIDSGSKASTDSKTETVESFTDGVSFDIQNGMALELMEYCDNAIERLKIGQTIGLWNTIITYSAENQIDADIIRSCLLGELVKPATNVLPPAFFSYPEKNTQPVLLTDKTDLMVPMTTAELSMLCTPPTTSAPFFEIKISKQYPMIPSQGDVEIGKVSDGNRAFDKMSFSLKKEDLNKHTFICGITGSGKTTTVKGILSKSDTPYLVIESAKKEYRNIRDIEVVYTLGKPEINCVRMNPFYVQYGINLQTHIDFLKDLFNASFSFYGPMPYILEKCLSNIYRKKGWNVTLGYHPLTINLDGPTDVFDVNYMQRQYALKTCSFIFPTMQDLKDEVQRYIEEELKYDGEVAGNIKTAILSRLESLCVGSKGFMFNTHDHLDMETLMSQKIVFELEGLADDSDKAFCVGMLLVFINEYRQISKELDSTKGLKHLLVIEEAHRLLKNVSTEKTSESIGNPKGKAVEHFTNMIAEMRSYGQGVIIAEQIPSKLAPDVIKNSSNKIVQRIVSGDDQELIANAIGMDREDAVFLGNLKAGYALCHAEGMNLPVLVAVNDFKDTPKADADIQSKSNQDITDIFDKINQQLISESISGILDSLAFKILNSLMITDDNLIAQQITQLGEIISFETERNGIKLLPMTTERQKKVFGELLAERILIILNNGIYSFGRLVPDELYQAIMELCQTCMREKVAPVREQLKKAYQQEPKQKCFEIIPHIIKLNYDESLNLENTLRTYFLKNIPETALSELLVKTKEVLKA